MWVTGGTGKYKHFKSVFTGFGPTDPWPSSWPGKIEVNGMPFHYDPQSIGGMASARSSRSSRSQSSP